MTTTAYDFSLVNTYFHISPDGVEHVLDEMPASGFFQADRLEEMMRKAGKVVQAIDLKLPGSLHRHVAVQFEHNEADLPGDVRRSAGASAV